VPQTSTSLWISDVAGLLRIAVFAAIAVFLAGGRKRAQSGRVQQSDAWPPMERKSIFTSGVRYRVRREWYGLSVGEELIYDTGCHTPQTSECVYVFVAADGTKKTWCLADDEPLDRWRDYFEPL
jgi:hypothetical protein